MSEVVQRFSDRRFVPPGGAWFYTVPETGAFFKIHSSEDDLVNTVRNHYIVNHLTPPSNLLELLEDYMCHNIPSGFCTPPADNGVKPMDFFSVLSATELLIRSLVKPDFFVSQQEAERRASICAKCPFNMKHMCTNCNGLRDTFRKMISKKTTTQDEKLGVCKACGCGLQCKVHVNKKYLDQVPEDQYHEDCWMREER